MATSKHSFGKRLGAYLGSNQNLAGSALALVSAGSVVALHFPPLLVPIIAVGAYATGALLAPVRRSGVLLSPDGAAKRAEALQADLAEFSTKYRDELAKNLPQEVHHGVGRIIEKIEFIVNRFCEQEAVELDQTLVVSRTLTDYLPTSLETYAGMPHQYRMHRRDKVTGTTAHEELMGQLETLEERMTEALEAVLAGDMQALRNQGRFLEQKFHRSDLDLDVDLAATQRRPEPGGSVLDLDSPQVGGRQDQSGSDEAGARQVERDRDGDPSA